MTVDRETVGAVSAPATARIPALDGLRGLAISLVMLYHFLDSGDDPRPHVIDLLVFGVAGSGWSGVDLFFVLSGFLITGILLDAKGRPHYFRNFYARRTLRIFPLYYAVLVVFFLGLPLMSHPLVDAYVEDSAPDQLWFWIYLTNIRIAVRGDWYGVLIPDVLWSLAIEEQFYLVWPLMILLISARTLLMICLGLFVVAFAVRLIFVLAEVEPVVAFVLTVTRMDGLILGSFLALVARGKRGLERLAGWARWLGLACLFLLIGLALPYGTLEWDDPWTSTAGFSLLALLYGSVLVLTVTGGPGAWLRRIFELGFLRMLGKYSYALYLFHGPVGTIIQQFYDPGDAPLMMGSPLPGTLLYAALAAALSLLVSWGSWNLLERHFLGLQRWFRGPASLPS
jgi:peptidoglycan/LPS O-acetylase OafA/YrhL